MHHFRLTIAKFSWGTTLNCLRLLVYVNVGEKTTDTEMHHFRLKIAKQFSGVDLKFSKIIC